MGNELHNDKVLRTDTELGKYIKDFLINKHKFTNDTNFTNYLKKRACCTNNNDIPISLPSYDITSNKVYPMTLSVRVFDVSDNKAQICNINGINYYDSNRNRSDFIPKTECASFYSNFCNKVNDERLTYTSVTNKRYGPYKDVNTDYNNNPKFHRLQKC